MGWKIVLLAAAVLLEVGCTAKHAVQQESHYKIYTNVPLTKVGSWTPMDIQVPKGAMVAFMGEGELWNVEDPNKKHVSPTECLKFRIGEQGVMRHLYRYYDTAHVTVVRSIVEGPLYYNMGPFLKEKDKRKRKAKMTATVIVWERGQMDNVDADIRELVLAYPEDKKYKALLFNLAGCFTQIGEYSRAERVLERLRESEGKQGREAVVALNLSSENEKWLRRYDRVKAYAQESLQISSREGYKGLQGEALLSIAYASFQLGQRDEAMSLAEQALQLGLEMRPGNPYLVGRSHQELAGIQLNSNRLPAALEHGGKAVENLQKARAWRPLAQSYFLLGQAQRRSNMKEEARKSYQSAIKIAGPIGRSETVWRAHSQLGRMAEGDGNTREAFEQYAQAIKTVETMRRELSDPGLKSLFMEDKFFVYEWMIQLLHKMKRDDEALHYLERAKARVMLDMLRDKTFASGDRELNELLARERSLRDQVQELASGSGQVSLQEMEEEDQALPESGKDDSPALKRLQSELESVVRRIEVLNPDLASLLTVNPLRAKEIQALLDGDTALLAYFMGSEMNVVFMVTREKITGIEIRAQVKEMAEKVKEFRSQTDQGVSLKLFTSKEYVKPLSELYVILIGSVEGEIADKRHLVVVPHGVLHYLPFQALRSPEGRYLIDSFTVSYLPSASVLKYARSINRGNHRDLLAAANPITDLAPLPAAEAEAREVSALFERKLVLLGSGATKSAVKKEGPRYDFLLFSTHGEMIESDPLKSNLRFTPSPQDDGKLTVSEIFDMEVKANLVTLSACETALARGMKGDLPQGDDLVGLSRAFIHAGTPSVVASLWRVSDDSTVVMMRSFYRNLRSMSKAEALRQSQVELAKASSEAFSHPFFWAPFILVGDWN